MLARQTPRIVTAGNGGGALPLPFVCLVASVSPGWATELGASDAVLPSSPPVGTLGVRRKLQRSAE